MIWIANYPFPPIQSPVMGGQMAPHMLEIWMQQNSTELIGAYFTFIRTYLEDSWDLSFITFMFKPLPGSQTAIKSQMIRELERVYSIFVTRVVRSPNSGTAIGRMPILICAPDFPVPKFKKSKKMSVRYAAINGGLHWHGLLLVPPHSRLREGAEEHFRANEHLYVGDRNKVIGLDVREVATDPAYVARYALKAIRRGKIGYDELLVLPKCQSELQSRLSSNLEAQDTSQRRL